MARAHRARSISHIVIQGIASLLAVARNDKTDTYC